MISIGMLIFCRRFCVNRCMILWAIGELGNIGLQIFLIFLYFFFCCCGSHWANYNIFLWRMAAALLTLFQHSIRKYRVQYSMGYFTVTLAPVFYSSIHLYSTNLSMMVSYMYYTPPFWLRRVKWPNKRTQKMQNFGLRTYMKGDPYHVVSWTCHFSIKHNKKINQINRNGEWTQWKPPRLAIHDDIRFVTRTKRKKNLNKRSLRIFTWYRYWWFVWLRKQTI